MNGNLFQLVYRNMFVEYRNLLVDYQNSFVEYRNLRIDYQIFTEFSLMISAIALLPQPLSVML
ncbi:hypothetical protein E4665_10070 [Sporolactobacillus shoreae]|uniref:Uncharacterized protein n=1 Tax=Sporolactobacillus shoreae TaxID=1465501 RepID=A0A4Z0GN64_9BACL|nr:hypothetical protein E4665_10070 [Sporolactobacillus shoreae]